MPSTRDIRRRIRSVKNTSQITKAMQMVASSKMSKAQQAAVNGRPFATLAADVLARLASELTEHTHPLMEPREVRKRAVIVVSTDKGLCGALNANLFREALRYDPATTVFVAAGKKAAQFLARARRQLVGEFSYRDTPSYGECRAISKFAQDLFLKGEADRVEVLYTRFLNTLSQRPDTWVLLPTGRPETLAVTAGHGLSGTDTASKPEPRAQVEHLFEPGPEELLDVVLDYLLDFRISQLLLEAKASEHSARMVAMKNATDNAGQLIKQLTLEYNKLRQANITKELLEISSAAMAVG
jgi:F-type H+-transporting ATPase subunit gamma